ncbi:MAG TPA: aminopeptidase P family protein [Corynebacteriales bacterium]|nr:aminopeptidase P family protein [Mycobacteriales bacterium]
MHRTELSLAQLRSSQPLSERASNRSRSPQSEKFQQFMAEGWSKVGSQQDTSPLPVAEYLPARHAAITRHYPGTVLVVPAGTYKTSTADEAYPFRPHSAFVWLTGMGGTFDPDSAIVFYPQPDGSHQAVLYFEPAAGRDSEEFYADSRYGEFWVGARPSTEQIATLTGLTVHPLSALADELQAVVEKPVRVLRGVDADIEALLGTAASEEDREEDRTFEVLLNTARMWKDEWEVSEIRKAVDLTHSCMEEVVRVLPQLPNHPRGERLAEVAFDSFARLHGNGNAFDTIAAAGANATTMHYGENSAPVAADDLLLIDAGAQRESLYGGDITRTFPVSGRFSAVQRRVYDAVVGANEAAFAAAAVPGCLYREVHDAAVRFLAEQLAEWGVLPCSVEEAVSREGQQMRRWMPHGTGHHLGLDTHDCALAPRDVYLDMPLEPGMVFTIEPGLYFRSDDELVPAELRGIGVRVEDDVLVTESGVVRLSADIPRSADAVEAWIQQVQAR